MGAVTQGSCLLIEAPPASLQTPWEQEPRPFSPLSAPLDCGVGRTPRWGHPAPGCSWEP